MSVSTRSQTRRVIQTRRWLMFIVLLAVMSATGIYLTKTWWDQA